MGIGFFARIPIAPVITKRLKIALQTIVTSPISKIPKKIAEFIDVKNSPALPPIASNVAPATVAGSFIFVESDVNAVSTESLTNFNAQKIPIKIPTSQTIFIVRSFTKFLKNSTRATLLTMSFFEMLGIGIFFAAAATFLAVRFFPAFGLLDFPARYNLNRPRRPYPGGLALAILIVIFLIVDGNFWPLALAILTLGAISFVDDRKPLPVWIRGIFHAAAAMFVFFAGVQISQIGNPFGGEIFFLPIGVSAALTLIWIVVIQNSLNWFDGLRGLSVGVSGVGFLALGIFGLVRPEVAWEPALPEFLRTMFFLAGICAGSFLWFFRGKILLGDSGSQVLGFLLAVFSILAGTKIATTLLVLGLPILDLVFVSARRVFLEHRSPFSGDQRHLHHNLAKKMGEKSAVLLLIGISAVLGAIGIFFTGFSKILALGIAVLLLIGLSVWAGKKSRQIKVKS